MRRVTSLATVLPEAPDVAIAGSSHPCWWLMCGSEEGHNSKECDKPLTPEFLATITCRRCEQTGHITADCPEKPKFVCHNCDQEGHRAKDCPVTPFLSLSSRVRRHSCWSWSLTCSNLPMWIKLRARSVGRLDIMPVNVLTRNVATVNNPVIILGIALYLLPISSLPVIHLTPSYFLPCISLSFYVPRFFDVDMDV